MSTTHPNMFPHAGETGMHVEADAPGDATDADVAGVASAGVPSSPWANSGNLQRFASDRPPEASKPKRETHIDRAIAYLREHGPAAGGVLCEALGLDKNAGVTPHIGKALKDGRIVRGGGKYGLPSQIDVPDAKTPPPVKPDDTVQSAKERRAKAEVAVLVAELERHLPSTPTPEPAAQRTPEFTLTVGDAMLLSWPDGSVTVQRGGSFVELSPEQTRMFGMHSALR